MANWTEGTKTYIAQGNTPGWKRGTHQRRTQPQRGATSQARVCGMVFEWTKIKNQPLIFQIQLIDYICKKIYLLNVLNVKIMKLIHHIKNLISKSKKECNKTLQAAKEYQGNGGFSYPKFVELTKQMGK